ncbi:hypothetical protein LTR84_006742 [Exophiala bonariae]|uniref:Uncharacterized protein n=1 Tax=Exophiala bonariae TaxID=1690606 RepID=A0AAV9N339_9EURO|nr:hypothetical protein LTR84_006742 [Exophiala bonariae]
MIDRNVRASKLWYELFAQDSFEKCSRLLSFEESDLPIGLAVVAMSAARLSPSANLLRNSRLFAIPSALPLPVAPTYTETRSSDTATTIYPIRAALETPKTSLKRGDWGLKRALPIKTTTKTGTPTFRIRGGIDTPQHTADFESAADHVINLKKFQELDLRITLPDEKGRVKRDNLSPFAPDLDNTTVDTVPVIVQQDEPTAWLKASETQRVSKLPEHLKITLEQFKEDMAVEAESDESPAAGIEATAAPSSTKSEKRRWRYTGPYLAGITQYEFDKFLSKITAKERGAFRDKVKQHLISQRTTERRSKALDEGLSEESATQSAITVTEEEVTEHLRYLRSEPGQFGPLIATFFDLADGPQQELSGSDPWSYGRDTITALRYRQTGPPTTHPSAGLSYQYSGRYVLNDVKIGPIEGRQPAAGRILQSSALNETQARPLLGVAGFVASNPNKQEIGNVKWDPVPGGPRCVVSPTAALVGQSGKLEIQASVKTNWHLKDNVPTPDSEKKSSGEQLPAAARSRSLRTPSLRRSPGTRVNIDMDLVEEMDRLNRSASQSSNLTGRV